MKLLMFLDREQRQLAVGFASFLPGKLDECREKTPLPIPRIDPRSSIVASVERVQHGRFFAKRR